MIFFSVLNPRESLVKTIFSLLDLGVKNESLCVIDDGSYEGINFLNHLKKNNIRIIHHKKNYGKGKAIKTGLKFAKENNIRYSIFADSDGQHDVYDIFKIYLLSKSKNISDKKMIVTQRNFDTKIPIASKIGNLFSALLINFLFKNKLIDTQCGLRLIPFMLYDHFLLFKNNGFDFEVKCLIYCIKNNYIKSDIFIKTIYSRDRNSHFKKIIDSTKVIIQIFKFNDF
jgi:glycosyltransferase involved in cell wall biosynthesis